MLTIGIICGGPSAERGISLNSARSVLDHLKTEKINIKTFFVDQKLQFYALNSNHLYSNTTADFDYKLQSIATYLNKDQLQKSLTQCDLIFPTIHGYFGEDGQIQKLLENINQPFVGSSSQACQLAYHKNSAISHLEKKGFATIPSHTISKKDPDNIEKAALFWEKNISKEAIIKPVAGGSSIDVYKISSTLELKSKLLTLFEKHESILLQPFYSGDELTILVIEESPGNPIALPPTQTKLLENSSNIFDYRSKYLPTMSTHHYTPAHINQKQLTTITSTAVDIFKAFDLKDAVRLDGWIDPEKGFICNDINPLSGMEENSFLFKQAASCNFTHNQILTHIINNACKRNNIPTIQVKEKNIKSNKPLYILFGGENSERQVSLMSGRNIWLKMLNSKTYNAIPFFLDSKHNIWQLPYHLHLHHTVEEIENDILNYQNQKPHLKQYQQKCAQIFGTSKNNTNTISPISIDQMLTMGKKESAFIFLALHGGIGENGTLQEKIKAAGLFFNGSEQKASQLCMDKHLTQQKLQNINSTSLIISKQYNLSLQQLQSEQLDSIWEDICKKTQHDSSFIIKPRNDGCSAGICYIENKNDLIRYGNFIKQKAVTIAANSFKNQTSPIEVAKNCNEFLLEPYIYTDDICVNNLQIQHNKKTNWIELTIVVLEKNKKYKALTPSITVSSNAVLTLEEKFQGGTGINLTPPPEEILSTKHIKKIKELICLCAQELGIENYARIDLFYNEKKEKMIVIEANTLPGLTPSTVLFQQALAEDPPITPIKFIEMLLDNKRESQKFKESKKQTALA